MSVKLNSWKINRMFILDLVLRDSNVIYSIYTAVYTVNMTQTIK